jgi:hypothetical protein
MLLRRLAQRVGEGVRDDSNQKRPAYFEAFVQERPMAPVEVVEGPSQSDDFESFGGGPLLMQVLYGRVSKTSLF